MNIKVFRSKNTADEILLLFQELRIISSEKLKPSLTKDWKIKWKEATE